MGGQKTLDEALAAVHEEVNKSGAAYVPNLNVRWEEHEGRIVRTETTERHDMQLPEKLSDLLDLAVTDAIKASKKPGFRLNMARWVRGERRTQGPRKGKKVCTVCMAGAVMTQTLCMLPKIGEDFSPFEMNDRNTAHALRKINGMRSGTFWCVYSSDNAAYVAVARASILIKDAYNDKTGRAPWRVYRKAAAILREAGL